MSARIATQHKTPFEIDPRPLDEMASPHAGLLATSPAQSSVPAGGPKPISYVQPNVSYKRTGRVWFSFIVGLVWLKLICHFVATPPRSV